MIYIVLSACLFSCFYWSPKSPFLCFCFNNQCSITDTPYSESAMPFLYCYQWLIIVGLIIINTITRLPNHDTWAMFFCSKHCFNQQHLIKKIHHIDISVLIMDSWSLSNLAMDIWVTIWYGRPIHGGSINKIDWEITIWITNLLGQWCNQQMWWPGVMEIILSSKDLDIIKWPWGELKRFSAFKVQWISDYNWDHDIL